MRPAVLLAAALLVCPLPLVAQRANINPSDRQRASTHYASGWTAMHAESWNDAAREFQQAIDNDATFTLAYYALGRAEMGRRDFAKAIAAYTRCRDMYQARAGEQFNTQVTARQRLDDRIRELQMAVAQAVSRSGGRGGASPSQGLMVRELQAEINRLQQARDRNISSSIDMSAAPFFVPLALGAAYFRNGQFADAEREYKEAVAANAASGETHNNLAVLYLTTGRYDEAEAEVRAAEKVGFKVNENLKGDIKQRKKGSLALIQ
jgi:tetratricopeptide (TPR) repeat protein